MEHTRHLQHQMRFTGTAEATVIRHWTRLLDAAQQIYDTGHYGAAVVIAASACEVVVDRAMTFGFRKKNVPELEVPVTKLLFSSLLKRKESQRLYEVLSGDKMTDEGFKQPFWDDYLLLVDDRKDVAHNGKILDQADALRDLTAAKQFVAHVEKHNALG